MPTWLLYQGLVLLRQFVHNKNELLCNQVLLIDVNQSYTKFQLSDGKESTVSTSDLAHCPGNVENDIADTTNSGACHGDQEGSIMSAANNH